MGVCTEDVEAFARFCFDPLPIDVGFVVEELGVIELVMWSVPSREPAQHYIGMQRTLKGSESAMLC